MKFAAYSGPPHTPNPVPSMESCVVDMANDLLLGRLPRSGHGEENFGQLGGTGEKR